MIRETLLFSAPSVPLWFVKKISHLIPDCYIKKGSRNHHSKAALIDQVLQIAHKHKVRLLNNLGLYAKTLPSWEGIARQLNPDVNLISQI